MSAYSFASPNGAGPWNREPREAVEAKSGGIRPFDRWLTDQADAEVAELRRVAIRATCRRPALLAMFERRGPWPTFTDYAFALGVEHEQDMLSALGRAWNAWRREGNASTPRLSENGGDAS